MGQEGLARATKAPCEYLHCKLISITDVAKVSFRVVSQAQLVKQLNIRLRVGCNRFTSSQAKLNFFNQAGVSFCAEGVLIYHKNWQSYKGKQVKIEVKFAFVHVTTSITINFYVYLLPRFNH